jgi:ABC transporter.
VSFVTQDSFLFAASIAENIAYDDPQRPPESIWAAADAAQLAETINSFGNGLSTLIGERGVTLSGGQKQRASLARSLIRQTPILLLDDSFSALDTETGALILAHLRSLRHRQTTIMVSHRVANARYADRIVVLEKGRIIETGNHAQLLAMNGHYADLVRQPNQPDNLEPAI